MTPKIIFENENILILNKPAGLVVHSSGKTKEPILVDWLLENYSEVQGVGESLKLSDGTEIEKPGIVHRLDRETSGVIVVALNQESFLNLKEQFKEREVGKVYEAFVYGNIKDDEGVVDRPIGRSSKDFRQWSATRGARGEMREAVTEYKVLKRGEVDSEKFCHIEVRPKTGRTHQIRVHMKAKGNPIICDKLYAPNRPCLLGFKHTALHAKSIKVKDLDGTEVSGEAPYPEDFKNALESL